jgi:uncharacterized protein (DUF433 family)
MTSTDVLRTAKSWVQKTPDVCGGDACIRGTRVPVWAVIAARQGSVTDADLLKYFVTPLTPEDLEAATVYYERHRDEIDKNIADNDDGCA